MPDLYYLSVPASYHQRVTAIAENYGLQKITFKMSNLNKGEAVSFSGWMGKDLKKMISFRKDVSACVPQKEISYFLFDGIRIEACLMDFGPKDKDKRKIKNKARNATKNP